MISLTALAEVDRHTLGGADAEQPAVSGVSQACGERYGRAFHQPTAPAERSAAFIVPGLIAVSGSR